MIGGGGVIVATVSPKLLLVDWSVVELTVTAIVSVWLLPGRGDVLSEVSKPSANPKYNGWPGNYTVTH